MDGQKNECSGDEYVTEMYKHSHTYAIVTFQKVQPKSNFAQSNLIMHMVITYECTRKSTFNPYPQHTGT